MVSTELRGLRRQRGHWSRGPGRRGVGRSHCSGWGREARHVGQRSPGEGRPKRPARASADLRASSCLQAENQNLGRNVHLLLQGGGWMERAQCSSALPILVQMQWSSWRLCRTEISGRKSGLTVILRHSGHSPEGSAGATYSSTRTNR